MELDFKLFLGVIDVCRNRWIMEPYSLKFNFNFNKYLRIYEQTKVKMKYLIVPIDILLLETVPLDWGGMSMWES